MKHFDCFPFFNELELLHLRLLEYYEFVDYFVLVEATKSHTGKNKPLYYKENKDRFEDFSDKIINVIVQDMPEYNQFNIWPSENYQRNAIMNGLQGTAETGDKIYISDCDEFWDIDIAKNNIDNNSWVTFRQELFYYYVNCKQNCTWDGSVVAPYGSFKDIQTLRDFARYGNGVQSGGWHFSFMGGAERIKEKVENIAESHLIIDKVGSVLEIQNKIDSVKDLWNRTDDYAKKSIVPITYKPKKLDEWLKIYPNFMRG